MNFDLTPEEYAEKVKEKTKQEIEVMKKKEYGKMGSIPSEPSLKDYLIEAPSKKKWYISLGLGLFGGFATCSCVCWGMVCHHREATNIEGHSMADGIVAWIYVAVFAFVLGIVIDILAKNKYKRDKERLSVEYSNAKKAYKEECNEYERLRKKTLNQIEKKASEITSKANKEIHDYCTQYDSAILVLKKEIKQREFVKDVEQRVIELIRESVSQGVELFRFFVYRDCIYYVERYRYKTEKEDDEIIVVANILIKYKKFQFVGTGNNRLNNRMEEKVFIDLLLKEIDKWRIHENNNTHKSYSLSHSIKYSNAILEAEDYTEGAIGSHYEIEVHIC